MLTGLCIMFNSVQIVPGKYNGWENNQNIFQDDLHSNVMYQNFRKIIFEFIAPKQTKNSMYFPLIFQL